jgi:hypothetical protein
MTDLIKYENRELLYTSIAKELNLKEIEERYFPQAFGNFFIVFLVDELLIRYCSDRSDLTIEVANSTTPPQWCDLSFVKNYIYEKKPINSQEEYQDNDYTRIMKLNAFLKSDFDKITALFNQNNYQNTLNQIHAMLKQVYKGR